MLYEEFLSRQLLDHCLKQSTEIPGLAGLRHIGKMQGLEDLGSLKFLLQIYEEIKIDLHKLLTQRVKDRQFIDERMRACSQLNKELQFTIADPDYQSVLGLEDAQGRVVFGPRTESYASQTGKNIAELPEYLKGPHVTLFGPPDSAKMAINAMNCYHRKLKGEPPIVEELLSRGQANPKWGADDEDSKTPLREDLQDAAINLTQCFNGKLSLQEGGKSYSLQEDHLADPIKRFPGLALPCTFLFYQGQPLPLHLYDFAIHLFHNWKNPKALVFYVPKLENEEEARYIRQMILSAESILHKQHPKYQMGTVRLMIVLENPRAILRTNEIMDELYPYFAGASLGWHDYLASTARLFKEDSNYRIPVKADPNIVIKYIKASHRLLADVVGARGGIKVGGMYGVLPLNQDLASESFQITLKGFFKDVVTQMKRDLTGYWVAHPDFVRIGLALLIAWEDFKQGKKEPLTQLVKSLLAEKYHSEVMAFIEGPDIQGLNKNDPHYVRSLLVADIKESDFIANNDPEEIRYNVFQSLQYLTDWLCGNGCVALPSTIDGIPVRVMDDLATAERSRWEVWHELYHGRFSLEKFLQIAHEELHFIRKNLSTDKKIVAVPCDERTSKWYPVAMHLMLKLMTDAKPVEFATELLLPFTVDSIRQSADPLEELLKLNRKKFELRAEVENFNYYFEKCGSLKFAKRLSQNIALDIKAVQDLILKFDVTEINEAAFFHGNIGEDKKTLDAQASREQELVFKDDSNTKSQLRQLGDEYLRKFGFKFLISAQGKTGTELLSALKERLNNPLATEVQNARQALWEITQKRLLANPAKDLVQEFEQLQKKHSVFGAAIAIQHGKNSQNIDLGEAIRNESPVSPEVRFELASLSKSLAAAFAMEFLAGQKIPLQTPVNRLLEKFQSDFRLQCPAHPEWAEEVTIENLLNHTALNMHYVNGVPLDQKMPDVSSFLRGNSEYKYAPIEVLYKPGTVFSYSGGGFLVLEHLLNGLSKNRLTELSAEFFSKLEVSSLSFAQESQPGIAYASGYLPDGQPVPSGRLKFPAFAAGAMGTAQGMLGFLKHLSHAYHHVDGSGPLSHTTAVRMLSGKDLGSQEFMGCHMGLGVFIGYAGRNKIAIHQGANEGFRALYFYVFDGPDKDKGFVILCNADNNGVLFISECAHRLIQELQIQGSNTEQFERNFDFKKLRQEEIVNLGYKKLIFDHFEADLPEKIVQQGALDPLAKWNQVVGAKVLKVTNQKFARAENLISSFLPTFDPELFGVQGKIMDSWESSRHNFRACDELLLELKTPSSFAYLSLSTEFHDGNQAEFVQLFGRPQGQTEFEEILPKTKMQGHSLFRAQLGAKTKVYSQVKVCMYPDGGLTRLGLFGDLPESSKKGFPILEVAKPQRFGNPIPKVSKPLAIPFKLGLGKTQASLKDFASAASGGRVIEASNEHYGPAIQVISPFPPLNMFDGLESARSRKPGHTEFVTIQLGQKIKIEKILLDFKFFINNNPQKISLYASVDMQSWEALTENLDVKAFAGNQLEVAVQSENIFQFVKLVTIPDGGVNRLKVFGKKS